MFLYHHEGGELIRQGKRRNRDRMGGECGVIDPVNKAFCK